MKIIIPNIDDNIAEHFGHAPQFTLVEIQDKKIIQQTTIETPGHTLGFLPEFFHEKGVDLVIAGGIGGHAIKLFNSFNIDVLIGIKGSINNIINEYLQGTLASGSNMCNEPHKH